MTPHRALSIICIVLSCVSPCVRAYANESGPIALEKVFYEGRMLGPGFPVLLTVWVGDQRLRGLLDTGCSFFVLDNDHENLIGERDGTASANTPFGASSVHKMTGRQVHIGTRGCDLESLVIQDLDIIESAYGIKVDCIVGMPLLRECCVFLSYETGKFSLAEGCKVSRGEGVFTIPLTLSETSLPVIRMCIDGQQPVNAVVDSGLMGPSILSSTVFNHGVESRVITVYSARRSFATVFGSHKTPQNGRARKILLGDLSLTDVVVAEGDQCLIGTFCLCRGDCALDFVHGKMIMIPRGKETWDHSDLDGMVLTKGELGMIVKEVERNGTAEKVGIRAGDEIVAIDGRKLASATVAQVSGVLSNLRRGLVDVILLREGTYIRVTLPMRP